MKFKFEGTPKDNIHSLMRKVGYTFLGRNENENEFVFVRPPKGYPRFHLYLEPDEKGIDFSLHLDQKKPSYKNSPAHNGEYDSKIVEAEAERIKKAIKI
ncbi:MAG: hypothetical protein PHW72_03570 [Candidatus Pacebacteria bacterium]|nr:hypothetical protein [Candidatus Paceibacterota bacterium]